MKTLLQAIGLAVAMLLLFVFFAPRSAFGEEARKPFPFPVTAVCIDIDQLNTVTGVAEPELKTLLVDIDGDGWMILHDPSGAKPDFIGFLSRKLHAFCGVAQAGPST